MSEDKSNSPVETFLFFREGGFYPIDLPRDTVAENAEINPGTLKVVHAISGKVIWEPSPPSDPQREGSETPETDALINVCAEDDDCSKAINKCRKLESQRNEAISKLTAAREAMDTAQYLFELVREFHECGVSLDAGTGMDEMTASPIERINEFLKQLSQLNDHE